MELALLPKILTARLNGKGPTRWTEDMGIDPLVERVMRAHDMFELDALHAAHHLQRQLVAAEDASRDLLQAKPVNAVERVVYVQAALVAVADGAWLGRHASPGTWAQHRYALPSVGEGSLPGDFDWEDYVDWERVGGDVLDEVGYLVVRPDLDQTEIWVFDGREVRRTLRKQKRNKGEE